ncbi:TolC family protein [Plebeiibacterium marinum]|uniref:TolC family protein n=1 Tax=Plebeiibacterium marinum TaxID=2992111 RepID=A0AAE3ME96_9BACT|nr:TolC family protein [Plebeiobacterium marinum]MCW3805846.1 TolC family protein [Plebeiobacterium marinum]
MIKNIAAILLVFLTTGMQEGYAQEVWSLEKCIHHAFDNNISIKRQELNTSIQKSELQQSKLNRLPSMSVESSLGYSFGYTWIQELGTNVNVDIQSMNIGVGASVNVFNGFNQNNTIKRNNANLLAAVSQTEKLRNDIALQITGHYLQILFDKELLAVAQEQYDVTMQQVERTNKLVESGSQAKGSYLEIRSQAAKEALNVTMQQNSLALSLLNLAQLLDLEDVDGFDVVLPEIPGVEAISLDRPGSVYKAAVDIMPQIKGANHLLESSNYDVEIAKSGYYPSLSLNGSWGSRASWFLDDPEDVNRSFSDQIESNKNSYIGATLRIPVFNKFQTRNNVKSARVRVMDAQYSLEQQKLDLRKEIQQAYADAMAAYNKYLSSNEAVESYKESFRYTEQKFSVGLVNSVDYNVAKTDYIRAQSDLLQSKYEYILRNKILDFYKGVPIKL